MEVFNKYNIFKELKLNQDFIENIKLFYVYKDGSNKINVIIVTNDDKTFVFGSNYCGVLGFGHGSEVKELTINENLSNKTIIDLKNSCYHAIARTTDGKVYCWGWNEFGYLGNGRDDRIIYKPELNQYLSDKFIIDICCSWGHSLVLTIEGQVYAWGWNYFGQIGNGNNIHVSIPYHVKGFNGEKVKAIACGCRHSMALTEKGNVFSWGSNNFGQLGLKNLTGNNSTYVPQLIEIDEIFEKVTCGAFHSMLLSCNYNIYVIGSNKHGQLGDEETNEQIETPSKLKNGKNFIDIVSHSHFYISIALSEEGIIFIWGQCGEEVIKIPIETQFTSFSEVFSHYLEITNTAKIVNSKVDIERNLRQLTGPAIAVPLRPRLSPTATPPKNDATDETKLFVNDKSRYKREFKELEMIGSGSFGKVYKTFNLFDEQNYAVKKLLLSGLSNEIKKKHLEELKLMARLHSDHIVQYKNSWIENNEILFIQMELCFSTLKEILLKKRNEFERNEFQPMSQLEYYVSSELFKEILKGVNYLHKQNPPIIHRDLKPSNILITDGLNGRFVKIADFGLAVVHKSTDETHTEAVGAVKYMAPEVKSWRQYDLKADVYSLGVITQELFDIDLNASESNPITDSLLKQKYFKLNDLIIKMMYPVKSGRPNCDQILKDKSSWALVINVLETDFSQLSLNEQSIEENFHKFFIKTKLMFS